MGHKTLTLRKDSGRKRGTPPLRQAPLRKRGRAPPAGGDLAAHAPGRDGRAPHSRCAVHTCPLQSQPWSENTKSDIPGRRTQPCAADALPALLVLCVTWSPPGSASPYHTQRTVRQSWRPSPRDYRYVHCHSCSILYQLLLLIVIVPNSLLCVHRKPARAGFGARDFRHPLGLLEHIPRG